MCELSADPRDGAQGRTKGFSMIADALQRYDVRLMSWGDGSEVPTSGNNFVIVGADNQDLLHIRIFDAGGNRVTDTDETKLPPIRASAISTLKQQLPGLLPRHVLASAEKVQVISEVTSIVGPPRVFLSYSKDSDNHAGRVLELADSLCTYGIDVILDRYHPAPEQAWPRWMEQNLDEAEFVLMVCTETYCRRAMGLEKPGKGHGVTWEGNLIYNAIYHRIEHDQPSGSRFIPILLPGSEPSHIPSPVQGHTYYQLSAFNLNDPNYEALYRHLTGQPATPQPDLGQIQILPPTPRPQVSQGLLPRAPSAGSIRQPSGKGRARGGQATASPLEASIPRYHQRPARGNRSAGARSGRQSEDLYRSRLMSRETIGATRRSGRTECCRGKGEQIPREKGEKRV